MNEREKIPWQDLAKQWEAETPLILQDQAIGQLLQFGKETEQQLSQQKEQIQQLTLKLADLRARMKVYVEREA